MLKVVRARVLASAVLLGALVTSCSREVFTAAPAADAGDAGLAGDAGFAGPGIVCGSEVCRRRDQVCCVQPADASSLSAVFAAASKETARCVAASKCLAPAVRVQCDGPSFCNDVVGAGMVCCVRHDSVKNLFTRTDCVARAGCDENGPNDVLCDRSAPTTCLSPRTSCGPLTVAYIQFDAFDFCQ